MVRKWLEIRPAQENAIYIEEPYTFQSTVIRNRIWYRGRSSEIEQMCKQLQQSGIRDTSFWGSVPANEKIRKIHSGLPKLIIRTVTNLVKSDLNEPEWANVEDKTTWGLIDKDIHIRKTIGKALAAALSEGDGCFKISMDDELSDSPILEFFSADRVEYYWERGKLKGVDFSTWVKHDGKRLRIVEHYGIGTITYDVRDESGNIFPIGTIPRYSNLKPVSFDGNFMLAIPLIIHESETYPGRGESLYDNKIDAFDAFDEVISQWIDAVRLGRVTKYIPQELIPRDSKGKMLNVNSFGSEFIKIVSPMAEDKSGCIDVVQPDIRYEAYLSTYMTALDLCLQGILSPATLGIDLSKRASGDAQREKKDVTGITRNAITEVLEDVLPRLYGTLLKTCDLLNNKAPTEHECKVTFGEYGAPDFDSRIESVAKAASGSIMSIEAQVDELWGSSKNEKWKSDEVARIKQEKGIITEDEPHIGADAE